MLRSFLDGLLQAVRGHLDKGIFMRKTIIAALTIPALLTVAGCQEKAEVPKEEYVIRSFGVTTVD